MMLIRLIFAVALLISAIGPALAADPVFPPGIRVGITPLVGLNRAKTFVGFETEDQGVKVLVTELPADAYAEVDERLQDQSGGRRRHQAGEHRDRGRPCLLHHRKRQGWRRPMCGAIR